VKAAYFASTSTAAGSFVSGQVTTLVPRNFRYAVAAHESRRKKTPSTTIAAIRKIITVIDLTSRLLRSAILMPEDK
jgi:hypothetical protein